MFLLLKMLFLQIRFVSSVPTRVTVHHQNEQISGNVNGERSFLAHVDGSSLSIEEEGFDPIQVEVPGPHEVHEIDLSDTLFCSLQLTDLDPCGDVTLDHFVRSPQGDPPANVFPSI